MGDMVFQFWTESSFCMNWRTLYAMNYLRDAETAETVAEAIRSNKRDKIINNNHNNVSTPTRKSSSKIFLHLILNLILLIINCLQVDR